MRPRLRKGWMVASMAIVVLVLDQLTKAWAVSKLSSGRVIHLFWTIDFSLAKNPGMSFSKGQGLGPVIGLAVIAIIIGLLWFVRSVDNKWQLLCIGAVIGGAAGNLADRLFRAGGGFLGGHVIDFINPNWWPVFNISDSAVVVGGILLAIMLSFQKPPPQAEPAVGGGDPDPADASPATGAPQSDEPR